MNELIMLSCSRADKSHVGAQRTSMIEGPAKHNKLAAVQLEELDVHREMLTDELDAVQFDASSHCLCKVR